MANSLQDSSACRAGGGLVSCVVALVTVGLAGAVSAQAVGQGSAGLGGGDGEAWT